MNQDYSLKDFDKLLIDSNLIGATSLAELRQAESEIIDIKMTMFRMKAYRGKFDYPYLKYIHKFLFENLYDWAGLDRYDMGLVGVFRKGETEFTLGSKIPGVSSALFEALKKENYFERQDLGEFIKSISLFLNGLNILHPFREGNGRVQRLFIEQLAHNAGYALDISTVPKSIMDQASILGCKGKTTGYEKLIASNIRPISYK
jgi:cell filamentation protein